MEIIMAQEKSSEAWFFELLQRAQLADDTACLRSDEALEAFLKANPLSEQEEKFVQEVLGRLRARFGGKTSETERPSKSDSNIPVDNAAFAALYRNQGPMNPEVQRRIEEFRRRVREDAEKKKAPPDDGTNGAKCDR
jgi:hypothetical protein